MVYAVTVDDFRKRITVIFRGSVTTNDFLTDLKSNHKKSMFQMLLIQKLSFPFMLFTYLLVQYNSDNLNSLVFS